jgi:fatty-acyl-CoA synthase
MHSHRTIRANARQPAIWQDLRAGDTSLVALPMFHITGLVGGLLGSVCSGAAVALMPRWDRRAAAALIQQQRVTHWTNIPTMVMDLLAEPGLAEFDLSSLRYIGGGGASMPDAVAKKLKALTGLDYVEGYGLTETAAPSHCNPVHAARYQCLGIPVINTRSCIVDPETLEPVEVGEPGEIVVSGPQVFLGYWNNPQASEAAFIEREGQRWFRTGDLGRMDADGFYYIADRLKRMINASGFKVWPAEVEALLFGHPAVQEACVIARRDPYRGESVKAVVVLRPAEKGRVQPDDIIAWARENMAAYKVPREVEFVDVLPKGPTGKVMWRGLQERQDSADRAAA